MPAACRRTRRRRTPPCRARSETCSRSARSAVSLLVGGLPARFGPCQQVAAAGLVRPILPGTPSLGRIRAVATIAGIDLALREVFDRAAELLCPQQRAGIARQIDRHPHDLDQRSGSRGEAMTAHQRHIVAAEAFREVAALLDIGDEQVGVAKIVGDVPDRTALPIKLPEWITG